MSRISRRDFIRVSGAVAGAAVLGSAVPSWAQSGDEFTEALVIGSGYGGAVAALRLGQAGINTIVLERGRRWPIVNPATNSPFATFNNPDGRSSWLSNTATGLIPTPIDRYAGVLELIDPTTSGPIRTSGVAIRNGAGVGGGSLFDNGIMLQPRRELFDIVFEGKIDYDEMDQVYYPRARQVLGHSTIPNDILNSPYYASTRANLVQAQAANMYQGKLVEFNLDWNVVRAEIAGTNIPSAIAGQSWFGLNSGAKNSVDKNYLKMAEDTGKVEIVPLHIVTDITELKSDQLYRVTADEITVDGTFVRQRTFTCRQLFMAAGATATPALLTKAREKGTMPRLGKSVGTDWGTNGASVVLRGGVGSFQPAQGGTCGHILMEDRAHGPADMVELVIPSDFETFALGGAPGFSLYNGIGIAPGLGSFTYDSNTDRVTLNWPNTDTRLNQFSANANSMLNSLNAANPGSFNAFNSEDPGYKASGGPALTLSPVGGASMGKVCNPSGRVHGHPGLYVVDGALIPGGHVGGVTPAWTTAALAERCMDRIIARL